jgi:hypothetical protein
MSRLGRLGSLWAQDGITQFLAPECFSMKQPGNEDEDEDDSGGEREEEKDTPTPAPCTAAAAAATTAVARTPEAEEGLLDE